MLLHVLQVSLGGELMSVFLVLFLIGLLVAALPWWPYKFPSRPQGAYPVSQLPSLPDQC